MLGEILAGLALNIASAGINSAVDKYNDAQEIKNIKKYLGVEKDAYLNDAIKYYKLLDNIDSEDFESQKATLMKVYNYNRYSINKPII